MYSHVVTFLIHDTMHKLYAMHGCCGVLHGCVYSQYVLPPAI